MMKEISEYQLADSIVSMPLKTLFLEAYKCGLSDELINECIEWAFVEASKEYEYDKLEEELKNNPHNYLHGPDDRGGNNA